MKSLRVLIVISFFILTYSLLAQSYIDPDMLVEAREYSYKMESAPIIDGNESEWDFIPWTELYYNDRDHNNDDLIDPRTHREDYRVRWKSAWVDGLNKIFFLFETHDDEIFVDDSIRISHRDNLSVRLDPYDEEIGGEPFDDPSKNSWSMRFQIDTGVNSGYEGNDNVKPPANAVAVVKDDQFPIRTLMEIEFTLPDILPLSEGYNMGYYPLFADNDDEDIYPNSKNNVPIQWPQMYTSLGNPEQKNSNNRVYPDGFWRNDFYWGNLECVTLNRIDVPSGSSIQSAISSAAPGSHIYVASGTYSENLFIDKPNIKLLAKGDVTINPSIPNEPVITIANDDVAYNTTIQGFKFEGQGGDTIAISGISIGSAQAKILDNEFYYFENPIVKGDVDSTKAYAAVIEDNYVYMCNGGIKINTPFTIIRYNYIEENTGGYGIDVKGTMNDNCFDIAFNTVFNHKGECAIGYGGNGTFTIHHNYLLRSELLYGSGDTSGDDGIENQDSGTSISLIYNNTIIGWKSDGIQMGGSSTGNGSYFLRNNLIAFCGANDYDIRSADTVSIDFSLSYENGENLLSTLSEGSYVESDPLFVNIIEDDYTLSSGSPAIDAGGGHFDTFFFKTMYRGESMDIGAFEYGLPTITSIRNGSENTPNNYKLNQNYPNPFNPTTKISFSIPDNGLVKLEVFNILGQKVSTIINTKLTAGQHEVEFSGSNLSTGIYFYTISVNDFVETHKMLLLK